MAVIILFDLDGTLYRTHETGLPAFREICNRNGIELTPQKEAFLLYTTTDSFLRKYAPDMDSGQRAASYGYGADGISDADVIVQNAAQLQAEIFRYLM